MSRRISVLVIDDEKAIRKVLKNELTLCGFEVYLARNGRIGIKRANKLAKKGKIEVILLDWMMPGMDGLKFLSKLKHNNMTENIPVFMLTAKSKIADIDRAYDIGADDYITKPFKVIQIGNIIRRKLQKLAEKKSKQMVVMNIN
ncbi:MAG: response regulator [Planctomycetes bacterium]|nr:response regulator [Planctomycetota bacterium]